MGDTPDKGGAGLPPQLRFLKTLVTVLTAAMILGVITITTLLVIRLNTPETASFIDPGRFALPDGIGVVGYSVVGDTTVIVGDDGIIRVYDTDSGTLLQELEISG